MIQRHPDAAGLITDCLSGDVNKDFSQLWSWIREFVSLPDDLPYGSPLSEDDSCDAGGKPRHLRPPHFDVTESPYIPTPAAHERA